MILRMKNLFVQFMRLFVVMFFGLVTSSLYAAEWVPKAPSLAARNYILIDFHSGKVLAEKGSRRESRSG